MNAKKLWRVFHRKIIHHDRRSIKIFISLETRSRAPTPNAGDWVTPIGIQISRFASEAQLSLFADHCCRWKSFKFGIYGICPGGQFNKPRWTQSGAMTPRRALQSVLNLTFFYVPMSVPVCQSLPSPFRLQWVLVL